MDKIIKNKEYYDVYDKERNKKQVNGCNKTIERGTSLDEDEYHIFVQVWLFNSEGKLLVEERSAYVTKPHIWCTSGGNVQSGEDSKTCAIREIKEELGLNISFLTGGLIDSRIYIEGNQHYFCDSYCYYLGDDFNINKIKLQKEEVERVEMMEMETIIDLMNQKKFFLYWLDYLEKIALFIKDFLKK